VTLDRDWAPEEVLPLPKKPQRLPIILSPEEVQRFLGCVLDVKHHAILTTCYAAGLRISEAVRLKPTGIDSQRMVIRVEQGKGQKDRYVMLSPKLLEILRNYWKARRPKAWLFPGDRADQPITRDAVGHACAKARDRSGQGADPEEKQGPAKDVDASKCGRDRMCLTSTRRTEKPASNYSRNGR